MQRMLLEVVYEATENAGIPMSKLAGTNTGCYVGCFSNDYDQIAKKDPETLPKYNSTGTGQSILSNRISFCFNLQGPSLTIDTACSSGLVALHMACQSLRTGESSAAIVGATNAILIPDPMVAMTNLHFLSPDGICYTFDSRANGYARGEGMAALVLKPLDNAIKDGDTIRAVIRGTAINSNGRHTGITLPLREAQARLIRTAYKQAGCDFSQTGYFEAHGTGTPAGDPIETGAIGETMGTARPDGEEGKLYVGSVKPNIGHLEGASGLAGMIKTILSMEKGVIAPNIRFEQGNKNIDFDKWRIRIPTEPTPWPTAGLRRASVNSFGYGGANSHVILDDAYHYMSERGLKGKHRTLLSPHEEEAVLAESLSPSESSTGSEVASLAGSETGSSNFEIIESPHSETARRPRIFHLTGHEQASVLDNAKQLAQYVESKKSQNEEILLDDLAYTLGERRSALDVGAFVVASSAEDLISQLKDLDSTKPRSKDVPSLGFIFTGQGAQWWAMGRELMQYEIFERSIIACSSVVASLGSSWSLIDEFLKDQRASRINEAELSQPICTALQIGLVDILSAWGIRPDRVVGHSSGEIAAAYATGAISLESAMRVAYYRGLLSPMIKKLGYKGSMLAAGVSAAEAEEKIKELPEGCGKVSVACVNSPRSVTLSGDTDAINEMQKILTNASVFARKLQVETAYHSHHMKAIASEYLEKLSGLPTEPWNSRRKVTMFSSVKGRAITAEDDLGGAYWVENMVSSVLFSGALTELCIDKSPDMKSVDILVELGPHSALAGPVKQILSVLPEGTQSVQYASTLVRETKSPKGAAVTALIAAATLFTNGYPTNLSAANFPEGSTSFSNLSVLTDLPTYSWNRSRKYWSESRLAKNYRFRQAPRTDLLGAPVNDWNPLEPRWRNFIRLTEQPWVEEHKIQGAVAYPAAGYCCMAIEAAAQLAKALQAKDESSQPILEYKLANVDITRALLVPDSEEGVEVAFSLRLDTPTSLGSANEFRIMSWTQEDGWSEHCRGTVQVVYQTLGKEALSNNTFDMSEVKDSCKTEVACQQIYERFDKVGMGYGPYFQGITVASASQNQVVGTVSVTDTASTMPNGFAFDRLVHPASMDAMLQMSLVALAGGDANKITKPFVPTWIDEVTVAGDIQAGPGQQMEVFADAKLNGFREFNGNVIAVSDSGRQVLTMQGLKFTSLSSSTVTGDENNGPPKIAATAVWEPDVSMLDVATMNPILDASVTSVYDYDQMRDRELLGYYFIDQVLQQINEESEFAEMHDYHQKFFRYMQEQRSLVVAGNHPFQTEEWADLTAPHVAQKINNIIANLRASDADGQMFARMGPALTAVLRKEVDPLALMMKDNLLFDYYDCAAGAEYTYPKVKRYISLLSHKYPGLDFLEIGAGTGGLTKPVLEALSGAANRKYPRCKSYTYTDISTGFFEKAAVKFQESEDVLDFLRLDIEQDPTTQPGFENKQFDVIIASNVLHATTDMHRTMSNARKLLRPGGKLVLLEVTRNTIGRSLIFGNLAGWWASIEPWRVDGPLMSEKQWETVCKDVGFSELEVCSPDTADPLFHQVDVMVATAIEQESQPKKIESSPSRVVLVTAGSDENEIANETAALLSGAQDVTVELCALQEVQTKELSGARVISFAELDESIMAAASADTFAALQRIVSESSGFIWVTRGGNAFEAARPEMAVIQGLLRSVRFENEHIPCVALDLSAKRPLGIEAANLVAEVFQQHFGTTPKPLLGSPDNEISEHDGLIYIKRAIEDPKLDQLIASKAYSAPLETEFQDLSNTDRALELKVEQNGTANSLVFSDDESITSQPLAESEVLIQVKAIGLNLRDAMVSAGQIADDHIGNECAGVISQVGSAVRNLAVGDRVVSWGLGSYATTVKRQSNLVQKIPDAMDFNTAASLPNAYITAYYSLVHFARAQRRDSVLVQNASQATGLCAIQIAQHVGCKTFATVRTEEEKKQLHETHGVPEGQIFLNATPGLIKDVKNATNGRGVNLVLNEGDDKSAQEIAFQIVAPLGHIIKIGGEDNIKNSKQEPVCPLNRSVAEINPVDLLRQSLDLASEVFYETMRLIFLAGFSFPLPLNVEPFSRISETMADIRKTGPGERKTVFELRQGDLVQVSTLDLY